MTPPTADMIRKARLSAGLTGEQAAALLGAGARTWWAWESGERKMPALTWHVFRHWVRGFPAPVPPIK